MFRLFKNLWLHPDADAGATGATAGEQGTQDNNANSGNNGSAGNADQQAQGQNATGEKTFTQQEVDAIVTARLARERGAGNQQEQNNQTSEKGKPKAEDKLEAMATRMLLSEVKATMAGKGVAAHRLDRACKLVTLSACKGDDGLPDSGKIETEIDAILKDFPELIPKEKNADGTGGFKKIGADGTAGQNGDKASDAAINAAFGLPNA